MFKKITKLVFIFLLFCPLVLSAADNIGQRLAGRILLQVEERGEAWYVSPLNYQKYPLARPANAFNLMRELGIGITDSDLAKIPVGFLDYDDADDDNDGLANRLETALGTDPAMADSDNDGYDDKTEAENGYNPLGGGQQNIDLAFAGQCAGKFYLQTEQNGEAWYINPLDNKRYYLGRPADAFAIMRRFSLGISNADINQITTNYEHAASGAGTNWMPLDNVNSQSGNNTNFFASADSVLAAAADAIRAGDSDKAESCFVPAMQKAIAYTMDFLDADGRLTLGNILSGSRLSTAKSSADEKVYTNEVYFSLGGYEVEVNFHVQKQPNEDWKLTNL